MSSSKEQIAKLYEDYHMYTEQLQECKDTIEIIKETPVKDLVQKLNKFNKDYEGSYEDEIKELLINRWTQIQDITKACMKDEEEDLKNVIKIKYAKKIFDELRAKDK